MQMARMAFLAVAYKGNPCLEDRKYENEKICVGGKLGGLSLMVSNFTTFFFFHLKDELFDLIEHCDAAFML